MSFLDWLYSSYPNPHIDGAWGFLHIIVLVLCIIFIICSSIFLRKRSEKTKKTVLWILASIIILFELARRVINFIKTNDYSANNVLRILLPRPGCAISCWLVILATIINKKYFYNFASIIGVLCGLIFFVYPGTGFNNKLILFENLYSIVTHALFFVMAICFITYRFTDFKYKESWKEGICFAVLFIYVILEIYVLKIESDPFYFMPNNDVQEIVGMNYSLFLPLYIVFIAVFTNLFYLIRKPKKNKKW